MYPNPRWARRVLPLAWLVCSLPLAAQPSLTTIEDTVFRADGQRFDGVALIEWRSFLASDSSSIAAYGKNSRIINGVLKVSLVPTTTASVGAYYVVKYSNNGRVLFTEYWAVSPSATSLKLKDVRLVGPPIAGSVVYPPAANAGPVQMGDVIGLDEELAARPRRASALFLPAPPSSTPTVRSMPPPAIPRTVSTSTAPRAPVRPPPLPASWTPNSPPASSTDPTPSSRSPTPPILQAACNSIATGCSRNTDSISISRAIPSPSNQTPFPSQETRWLPPIASPEPPA